jgi:hypothetical protein
MALPGLIQENGVVIERTGNRLGLLVGHPDWSTELQRAPDSGGSPGTYATIGLLGPGFARIYDDRLPDDGNQYWYRARHIRNGHSDGAWSTAVPATVSPLNPQLPRLPDYPTTLITIEPADIYAQKVSVSMRSEPDHDDNVLYYKVLADATAFPAQTDLASWTTYSGPVELSRDTTNVKKVGAFTLLNGIYGPLAIAEIAIDRRPAPQNIAVYADAEGNVSVRVFTNTENGSVKVAVSTSSFPSAATVRAESSTDGRSVTIDTSLNIKFGQTVYVGVLVYSRATAGGTEGVLATARWTWTPERVIDPEGLENAIQNGTFEDGLAMWAPNNASRLSIETSSPLEGAKSLKLSPQSTAGGGENIAISQVYWPKDSTANDRSNAHRILIRTSPGEIWRFQATGKRTANTSPQNPTLFAQEWNASKADTSTTWAIISFTSASTETKSAKYTVPAGIYYFTVGILQNSHATVAGESYVDGIFVQRIKRVQDLDDEFVGDDGNLDSGVGMGDGAIVRASEEGWTGNDANGEVSITFSETFQNIPQVWVGRVNALSYNSSLSGDQTLLVDVFDPSTTGCDIYAKNVTPGALTKREDDFASGNSLTAVGNTAEVDLSVAPDDPEYFVISFDLSVTATPDPGENYTATLVWAIDTNDGGGWIERDNGSIQATGINGVEDTNTENDKQRGINVSGMGVNDDVRLRLKALSGVGKGAYSGSIHGHNLATDGDTYDGVVYYTTAGDTEETAIPTANRHGVQWAAQEVNPS